MKCPQCGTEGDEGYCTSCGHELTVLGAKVSAQNQAFANWGQRVGASIVDYLILLLPLIILKVLLGSVVGAVALVILEAAYFVTQWLMYDGRTVGNRAVRTQVRDEKTGGAVSNPQALWRYFYLEVGIIFEIVGAGANSAPLLALAVAYFLVDLFFPLWDSHNQTLHDKLAHTIVVVTA
ncbi:MAG: RDD family protein [Acidimicrobiales bacterium]